MGTPRRRAPASDESRSRRGALVIAALAALVLVVIVALWPKAGKAPPAEPDDSPASEESRSAAAPPARTATPGVVVLPHDEEPAPVIDDIVLEKTEVCAGEENLVTVKAHTVNGTDGWLHPSLDGQAGASVPITLWLDDDGKVVGTHFVSVFGRGNTLTSVPLPSYRVKNCQPYRVVHVRATLEPNTFGLFDLQASIVSLPSPGRGVTSVGPRQLTPVSYAWSFGDGETATTREPFASHDYGGRPQTAEFSSFVVRVDVRGSEGDVLTGRTALTLPNDGYRDLAQKGVVGLMISVDPRFPRLDDSGRVVQKVRLWHIMPAPITIERATKTVYYRRGVGQSPPNEVAVESVLGTTTIPPGREGIVTTAVLDTTAEPDTFSITYDLTGKAADGHPVMGAFSILVPPPKPTAQNSRAVNDPLLKAKILAARRILGQDVVNGEDLKQLERRGAFAELTAQMPAAATNGHAVARVGLPSPPRSGPPK
jgi:hypothetical protein